MRQTALRALVVLTCVVSASCGGGSDSTSPSAASSPTPGGTGGSGGGSGGGTETFRVSTPVADSLFDDNDWDNFVEAYSASGSGSGGHLTFNGQAGADYRQITINIT